MLRSALLPLFGAPETTLWSYNRFLVLGPAGSLQVMSSAFPRLWSWLFGWVQDFPIKFL